MTRKMAKQLIRIDSNSEYTQDSIVANIPQVESVIDAIYDSLEQSVCDNCIFDFCGCSIQDSILQIDQEATFNTFGCNSFESKIQENQCAHAKQKNPF